jgi:hypothetical protein
MYGQRNNCPLLITGLGTAYWHSVQKLPGSSDLSDLYEWQN